MKHLAAVVLAAGKGTRMKSATPKVLHPLLGIPLLGHVIDLLDRSGLGRIVVVVGHGAEQVSDYLATLKTGVRVETVLQKEQLGTGHAVNCCRDLFKGWHGEILIICGDTPLLRFRTIGGFIASHASAGNTLSVLSSVLDDPEGYGRILRDAEGGSVIGIVEEKDADARQRKIREINSGTYMVSAEFLFDALEKVDTDNAQGEYYLTDIVAFAVDMGMKVNAYPLAGVEEVMGINSRYQLSLAEAVMLDRLRRYWMEQGVTFLNAPTVYVEKSVSLAGDVIIEPNVVLRGSTVVGGGARIGAFSLLQDAEIAEGQQVPPCSHLCLNAQGCQK